MKSFNPRVILKSAGLSGVFLSANYRSWGYRFLTICAIFNNFLMIKRIIDDAPRLCFPLILASGVLLSASAHALSTPEVRSVDWDKANTVRVGDSINTVYRITMSEGSQNNLWLNVDCQTRQKRCCI